MQRFNVPAWQWRHTLLGALTILFGLHLLRAFMPLAVYVLRDRFGWSAVEVGLLTLAVFLTAFLATPVYRFFGSGLTFAGLTLMIGLTRGALQLWTGDPLGSLLIAITGVVGFGLSLPVYLGMARRHGSAGTAVFGIGLLGGITLDLALNGWYLTYDISWQSGWTTTILIGLLVVVQLALLATIISRQASFEASDTQRQAWLWTLLGPYLFLQLLFLTNIAFVTSTTGWPLPLAYAVLLLAHVAGMATASLHLRRARWPLALGGIALLIVWQLVGATAAVALTAVALLLGQVALATWLMGILQALDSAGDRPGVTHLAGANGLGLLLLVLLIFLYYAGYDIALPFPNTVLVIVALALLGLGGLSAWRTLSRAPASPAPRLPRLAALAAALLLVLPLLQWLTWSQPATAAPQASRLRVMTYNLHTGFDPQGDLDLEAIASAIEAEEADVVALQEVSRGWVINGSVDMLAWLSQRLRMAYAFGPTADAQWGNALLSRYPITAVAQHPLPPDDLLLRRGLLRATLAVGDDPLHVFVTHFHHPIDASLIRAAQSERLVAAWDSTARTLIMGDLNATAGTPEIEGLRTAGLQDALEQGSVEPGFTYPAWAPERRIDYIWLTPDLRVISAAVPAVLASDHLPVVATVE